MHLKRLILTLLFFCADIVSAEGYTCEKQAQVALEIREDYKSYDEVRADVEVTKVQLRIYAEAGAATAERVYENTMKDLIAQEVFKYRNGVNGKKLYKAVYDSCVSYEKSAADRAAKQAAREAARQK